MPPKAPEEPSESAAALEKEMTPEPVAAAGAVETQAAKPAAAAPAAKPEDDPEIDLGGDLGKVKRSEVAKWKTGGMQEADYRKKTEELAAREKQLEDLQEMSDFLAKNPKKLNRILTILEEAEEAQAAASAGTGTKAEAAAAGEDAQAAIKKVLESIDPEDPASALLKAIYTELQTVKQTVGGFETREKEIRAQEQKQAEQDARKTHSENVANAQKFLKETYAKVEESLGLETEDEKAACRQFAISILKDNPKGYETQEEFAKAIKSAADSAAKRVKAVGEARLKKYLEGKSGPTLPGPGGDGTPARKAVTMETLQDTLESELQAVMDAK